MPRGPRGFPRLTTVGPFVEPDEIQPTHSTSPGIYSHEKLRKTQPLTHEDTKMAIETTTREVHGLPVAKISTPVSIEDTQWEYKKVPLQQLLDGNEFANNLLSAMSKFEQKYGNFDSIKIEADRERFESGNHKLTEEAMAILNGEDSMFDSVEELEGIIGPISRQFERGDMRDVNEMISQLSNDFRRVLDINDSIRDSREYWPPTIELYADDSGMTFGTVDGSHRTVALSQILGEDAEIFVWEWINEDEFF